jgi:phospholipid-binding lipoprotein MlaA
MAAGCASDPEAPDDPLEPMNRFFFDFNQRLDRHAALPAASFYTSAVPRPARATIHNVLNNLGGPVTAANDVLQLEFENAGIAASRFIINTTIGVAGIFDVATDWGLPETHRDFGETMGVYGMPPGPYLVLPFRGPTAVHHAGLLPAAPGPPGREQVGPDRGVAGLLGPLPLLRVARTRGRWP